MLAGGLSGSVEVYDKKDELHWGKPGDDALTIATLTNDNDKATIFAYEKDSALITGETASARRVGFFLDTHKPDRLTDERWQLFDAAVTWASHSTDNPPPDGGTGDRAILWGIDQHDSQLFSITDYTDPLNTRVDYGELFVTVDGKTKAIKDVNAFTIDLDNHTAYLAVNKDAKSIDAPWLGKIDLDLVHPGSSTEVTFVGEIDLSGNNDRKAEITGLDFDPTTGQLYGLLNEKGVDDLILLKLAQQQ